MTNLKKTIQNIITAKDKMTLTFTIKLNGKKINGELYDIGPKEANAFIKLNGDNIVFHTLQ